MKLTDFKGEEALKVLGKLLTPASTMLADKETIALFKSNKPKLLIAKGLIESHSKELLEILATINNVDVEEYSNKNIVGMVVDVVEMFNDKELIDFLLSQASQN